jgi:cysteinyl-tRNA synthetase
VLKESNYDVIYIDPYWNHKELSYKIALTKAEVDSLKYKANGGRRQVIAYISVGSAEPYRWYIQNEWIFGDPNNPNSEWSMKTGQVNGGAYLPASYYYPGQNIPDWLVRGYGGNFDEEARVQWWHPEWRDIMVRGGGKWAEMGTNNNTSSLDRVLNAGFDGVYLDNVGTYSGSYFTQWESYWLANGGIPGEN